ncbi:MAG: SDR family oxidoreductase [Alphaproteobacteria bacterium]|nr:SDR family oxidoreductase [Alphaproteobacteria bacterium]
MDLELKGKVALVTGGSQGIGKGICTELAREGVHVALCARKPGPLAETKREIEALGVKSLALEADVTNKSDIERTVQKTLDTFGRIDILVNNAGGDAANSHWVDDPDDVWEKNYNINLWPCIRFTRLAVKAMKAQGGGNIVNVSSVGGKIVSWPGTSDYSSAKAAILMLTLTWSVDLAPNNIRVNCVNPALIRTPLWEELAKSFVPQLGKNVEEVFKSFTERLTVKRTGKPEEVGWVVAFLASNARAGFITGQCWNVDGGYIRTI